MEPETKSEYPVTVKFGGRLFTKKYTARSRMEAYSMALSDARKRITIVAGNFDEDVAATFAEAENMINMLGNLNEIKTKLDKDLDGLKPGEENMPRNKQVIRDVIHFMQTMVDGIEYAEYWQGLHEKK